MCSCGLWGHEHLHHDHKKNGVRVDFWFPSSHVLYYLNLSSCSWMDNEVLVSHLPPHGKGDLRRWHVKIELLQGSLHVFVPQAIDEWIQGGSEDRVKFVVGGM